MPFGLGLGVLFLALYKGRAANKFGLLTGQIVAVDTPELVWLGSLSAVVLVALAVIWRPLLFASTDPDLAAARGVPVGLLSPVFMLLLGITVAMSVQVVGALLVLSVLCTPAAAAMRVSSHRSSCRCSARSSGWSRRWAGSSSRSAARCRSAPTSRRSRSSLRRVPPGRAPPRAGPYDAPYGIPSAGPRGAHPRAAGRPDAVSAREPA